MPIEILMPALSPTMEEGKLAKWHVKVGDEVTSGDVLAEIETDKATMEVEAVDEGVVGELLVAEGTEGVPVNKLIALLFEEGEDAGASGTVAGSEVVAAASAAGAVNEPIGSLSATLSSSAVSTATSASSSAAAAGPAPSVNGARVASSPLARRIAAQNNVDIASIKGSGPHGRIIKADVEAALANGTAGSAASATATAASGAAALTAGATGTALATTGGGALAKPSMSDEQVQMLFEEGSYEVIPHDSMRKIIAERLTESKQTIPHFYLNVDVQLDNLLIARKRMNEMGAQQREGEQFKLSVNDFIIKALGLALRDVPEANAVWMDGGTLRYTRCDVGVAVAVEGGLFTPVVRHADLKTLKEISGEMKDLASRARNRRLAPHEYQGGTTSISNLGMYGIQSFDAVINPPHATILAVGAGEQKPVVVDGAVTVATIMGCTLSCDHRVVDGALGAELLTAFKSYIEDPVRMLV